MDSGSSKNNATESAISGASRKRQLNVENFVNEFTRGDNILSSFGLNSSESYNSPKSKSSRISCVSASTEGSSVVKGQSPYFTSLMSTLPDTLSVQEPKDDVVPIQKNNKEIDTVQPVTKDSPIKAMKSPGKSLSNSGEISMMVDDSGEVKERELRNVGEFTISSLEQEYQELLKHVKEERAKDQLCLAKCSEALRDKTESIICNLEKFVAARYQSLDQNLECIVKAFEEKRDEGKLLQEDFHLLKTQMSNIMSTILENPFCASEEESEDV